MASQGYRRVLFGGQTLTGASDGGYQREGQVGAANIFGGAPRQAVAPTQAMAQQPTFAQLQAQGVARPAPTPAMPQAPVETTPTNVYDQIVQRFTGGPSRVYTPEGDQLGPTTLIGEGVGGGTPTVSGGIPRIPTPTPTPTTPPTITATPTTPATPSTAPGGVAGLPSLPSYAGLQITDADLLRRINAFLGRDTGTLEVGAPQIRPVGGVALPTMAGAEQGPAATQALQAQYLQALQSAIATPSRYDLPTFTTIRDAALADIQAQYGEQQRQQAAQLAARGLAASSVAARAGESLGERQARAVADLNAQLLQQAATTQAADRAAAFQAAQTGLTQTAAQQLDRFNALQNQYANALSEGRLQEALRIQTEQQNIQTGLQALQAVLGQNLGIAQLQQGGALGARSLSLQERAQLIDFYKALYGDAFAAQLTPEQRQQLGL